MPDLRSRALLEGGSPARDSLRSPGPLCFKYGARRPTESTWRETALSHTESRRGDLDHLRSQPLSHTTAASRIRSISADPTIGGPPTPRRRGHGHGHSTPTHALQLSIDEFWVGGGRGDAQAGMPSGQASGATCVQRLDDSRNSAIHTRYRISLRSSSLQEPRYPLLRVVVLFFRTTRGPTHTRAHAWEQSPRLSPPHARSSRLLVWDEKAAIGDSLPLPPEKGDQGESTGEGRARPRRPASQLPGGSTEARTPGPR